MQFNGVNLEKSSPYQEIQAVLNECVVTRIF